MGVASISVCMPYYNRQAMLDRSLRRYREFYPNLEISICDDGSEVPVMAPGCRVHYLPAKDHALNPCVPINMAVKCATGNILVLTNPEIEHREPILLEMLGELHRAGPDGYITASCRGERGQWHAHSSIAVDGGIDDQGRAPMPPGAQFHFCSMFHRSLWDRAGGFDEEYRQGQAFDDNDWLWRLHRAGARFVHRDDLVVHHYHTGTRWPEGGWARNHALFLQKWGDHFTKAA